MIATNARINTNKQFSFQQFVFIRAFVAKANLRRSLIQFHGAGIAIKIILFDPGGISLNWVIAGKY